jgi:trehalose 6-phosphate synthase
MASNELAPPSSPSNLIIISNRLPVTIKKQEDGSYSYSMSSGGLVTGLSGLTKSTTFTWLGWTGLEVPESDVEKVTEELKEKFGAVPVWLPDDLMDKHCKQPMGQLF